MKQTMRLGAILLAAMVPLTACGDDSGDATSAPTGRSSASVAPTGAAPSPSPTVPELAITGVDYGFQVSGSPIAGLTKISFSNAGKEEHMTGLGKIKTGKTLADVQAALKSNEEAAFEGVFDEAEGDKDAPQVLSPGYAASTYTTLTEGTYALICFIPAPDGKSHYEKGMITELKVGAAAGPAAPAPAPTAELSFKAGKLTGPATLPAGRTVFKVTTDANHELLGVVGLDGKTPQQGLDYFEAKFEGKAPAGPPQGALVLQLHDFEPADSILVEMDLTPGQVMFVCQLENEGQPKHTEKLVITVA
ncbi:MAG TPA: hypothetical protein VNB94_13195 [Mycobacteriales bacterium]|nr:hypothetical protein [Mycobacteriales bacterium]